MISISVKSPEKVDMTRVLFFGRSECSATVRAHAHLNMLGFETTFVESKCRGEPLPAYIESWEGDYIFCFRSLFVLPKNLLDRASVAAVNFHPAPVEYPGSGCLNFALYENAEEYGVTAHIMNEKVDNGRVLECRRFPILKTDTVDTLLEKTHRKCLELFLDFTSKVGKLGTTFISVLLAQPTHEAWRGEARRMVDLERLKNISLTVTEEELERIIRATWTPKFPPRVTLHGYEFVLASPHKS